MELLKEKEHAAEVENQWRESQIHLGRYDKGS